MIAGTVNTVFWVTRNAESLSRPSRIEGYLSDRMTLGGWPCVRACVRVHVRVYVWERSSGRSICPIVDETTCCQLPHCFVAVSIS